jgi:hypothetical protein
MKKQWATSRMAIHDDDKMDLITTEFVRRLLREGESNTLDYKRDQYPIVGATDEEKSELLKDILAFANASRRSDAYILIGVDEQSSGAPALVGVASHLDDAMLQQFVNSKTSRTVHFGYRTADLDGISVGIIWIPRQKRPVWLRKKFGKLLPGVAYYRRGTSTEVADPATVYEWGTDDAIEAAGIVPPKCHVELADLSNRSLLGSVTTAKVLVRRAHSAEAFEAYRSSAGIVDTPSVMPVNEAFWKELADFIRWNSMCIPVGFALVNDGPASLRQPRLVLQCSARDGLEVLPGRPEVPSEWASPVPSFTSVHSTMQRPRLDIEYLDGLVEMVIHFSDVHPGSTGWAPEAVWLGPQSIGEFQIEGDLTAENLAEPVRACFKLCFDGVERSALTQHDVLQYWLAMRRQQEGRT